MTLQRLKGVEEKSLKTKVNLKSLVAVTPSDVNTFPYQLLNGTTAILSAEGTNLLIVSEGECISECLLCLAKAVNIGHSITRTSWS
ncbi:hypothetical protein CY34DRAFT_14549 [Suillus luteus UH-Slu-Lm8-n1]|uniref:Uncharacterized protein n=1 Tax=Suillus luteus UH-Slu-Lm8-n1 TaxID=930992 RepID=A0A0D0ABQ2_9AGAM|nr:hypothetical protein CY34DRAFT_14549 [Suillus luteus UH-Slu-Lm8-n1]